MAEAGFTPGPLNPPPLSFGGPNILPVFDLIETLPRGAQERLRMLRLRSEEAHLLVPPFSDIQQASMTRIEAANSLKRLTDHQQYGGFGLPLDHASVKAAQRTVDKTVDEFQRLQARDVARTQAWREASAALATVELWLRDGRPSGVLLQDHEGEPPKMPKGEDVLDAIERHRGVFANCGPI